MPSLTVSPTCLPNGQGSARCSAFRRIDSAFEPSLYQRQSPPTSYRNAAIVFACSVVIHLITVAAAWCCAKAIASPVSFAQILFLMPAVQLIATLPVSIGGWGVRESSFMFAFAYAGLAQSDGLVISILFGAASFIVGMAGGIVWITYGLQLRPVQESRSAEAYAENI
jgi:uncharacterized membrane protein YbhN (UPF0104 family)